MKISVSTPLRLRKVEIRDRDRDTTAMQAASLTPWPLYPVKELRMGGSRAGLNVWEREKSLSLAGVRTPNCSARSLCYPAPGDH
jgi:hypothetical protein